MNEIEQDDRSEKRSWTKTDEYQDSMKFMSANSPVADVFYDGLEEILSSSDEESTDHVEDERISFNREQLVEYQSLIKVLRFVKVILLSSSKEQ